jgi:hypothetical protein
MSSQVKPRSDSVMEPVLIGSVIDELFPRLREPGGLRVTDDGWTACASCGVLAVHHGVDCVRSSR